MAGPLAILIILQFFTYSSWAMMQKTSLDFSNAKMNENGGLCIMQEICIDDLESLAGALPQQECANDPRGADCNCFSDEDCGGGNGR